MSASQERKSMSFRFRRSATAVVEHRSASNRWQAVAWEVAEGAAKAVLLIGSMAAGIVVSAVLMAFSLQP